jgi:hypothetical protein
MTPWTGDQPHRKAAAYTGQHRHRINRQIFMPRVVFERTVLVFEPADISCLIPRGHCDRQGRAYNV